MLGNENDSNFAQLIFLYWNHAGSKDRADTASSIRSTCIPNTTTIAFNWSISHVPNLTCMTIYDHRLYRLWYDPEMPSNSISEDLFSAGHAPYPL